MYCEIVLQGGLKGKKIVLQYSHCIAEKEAWRVGFELQYTGVYCSRGSWLRLGICIAIQKNCIATVEQGQGWTVLQYSGQPSHDTARAGQQARAQGRAGPVGKRRGTGLGVRGALGWAWQAWRTVGRACGRGACGRQAQAGSRRAGAGNNRPAGSAGRARPGRSSWLRAVHSVHSACFRSGSTRYFS